MRKTNEEAARTREKIVAVAADELRRSGIAETSVADMMAAAGLTPGGFYRHFESKEHLVAEALGKAGSEVAESLRRISTGSTSDDVVDAYINATRRTKGRTPSCPFATLGSEIARSQPETREAVTEAMEELFAIFGTGATGGKAARRKGILSFATLVGSLTLARISSDEALSREILDTARQKLHKGA